MRRLLATKVMEEVLIELTLAGAGAAVVCVGGGRLAEASTMEVGRWRRRCVLSVSVGAD